MNARDVGVGRGHMKAVIFSLLVALLGCACTDKNTTTSPSSTTNPAAPAVTERFAGTLPVGGARFYSFSIAVYGTVNANLVSMDQDLPVNLGLGSPSGPGCSVGSPTSVQISATTQVSNAFQPGLYCVNISDSGNLSSPATFVVTIDHP